MSDRLSNAWVLAARLLLLPVLAVVLGACGGSSSGGAPALVSIEVTPINSSIAAGTTAQFAATGIYADTSHADLTAVVTWSSSDPSVVSMDDAQGAAGRAISHVPGAVQVAAELDSVIGETTLSVTSAELVSIEVTPTNPSIALGTSKAFTATGVFTDQSTQNLTDVVTWSSSDTSVASVSNVNGSRGTAASLAVGPTTIMASHDGLSGSTELMVTAAVLVSVEVTPTTPSIALGTNQQLTATGIYSDWTHQDLTDSVTWSSSNPGVATVSTVAGTEGLASSVATGSSTITATTGAIQGSTRLTVGPAVLVSIGVTPTNPSVALGLTTQLTATGVYSDATTQDLTGAVTWFSSDAAVAQVSNAVGSEGMLTTLTTGPVTISATLDAFSWTTTVTVTPAELVSIDLTPSSTTIAAGRTTSFIASGVYTDATTDDLTTAVTWSSVDNSVATISNASGSEGLATAVSTGSTTIMATLGVLSAQSVLTVDPAELVSIDVQPTSPSVALGLGQNFTATGIYSDATTLDLTATVTWTSADSGVAAISNAGGSEGLATSLAAGSTTITAILGSVSGATDLAVTPAELVSIEVTPTMASVPLGIAQQLSATGIYTDATTQDLTASVAWVSSDDAIASVSNASGSEGLATTVALGTATVVAGLGGISGSTTLTVTAAELTSIEVAPASPAIALGTGQQLTATGHYTDATTQDLTTTVAWSSSDVSIATVSNASGSEGLASSVATGSVTITAMSGSVSGTTSLVVTAAVLASIDVTPANSSLPLGVGAQLTATGTYSDTSTQDLTDQVTWTSADVAVATVSNASGSEGLATSVAVGSTTVTATLGSISGSTPLAVTSAVLVSIDVTPADDSVALGNGVDMVATGYYSDSTAEDLTASVTWSSQNAAVATVSNAGGSEGLLSAVGVGMTTITATMGSVTGSTVVTVTDAVLVAIDVTPADVSTALGATVQFTAIGTYSDSTSVDLTTSVSWSSGTTAVATISNAAGQEGLASGVAEGASVISAALGAVSGSANLTVTSATLVSVEIAPLAVSIALGTLEEFVATGTYSDSSTRDITTLVTWSSSDTAVATISNAAGSEGIATSVALGTTTIKADIGGLSASTTLDVAERTLLSIEVTPADATLPRGAQQRYTAMGTFTDGATQDLSVTVTWKSSRGNIATISGKANIKTHQAGECTITATYGSVSGWTTLTVVP